MFEVCTKQQYIKKYYFRRPSVYKFVELFKSTNKYTVKNLSKYVYVTFQFRITNTVDINVKFTSISLLNKC